MQERDLAKLLLKYRAGVELTQKPIMDVLCYVVFWIVLCSIFMGKPIIIALQFGHRIKGKAHVDYQVQPWFPEDPARQLYTFETNTSISYSLVKGIEFQHE